jgi:hypothetical protein
MAHVTEFLSLPVPSTTNLGLKLGPLVSRMPILFYVTSSDKVRSFIVYE